MWVETIINNLSELSSNEYFQGILSRAAEIQNPLFWLWVFYVGILFMVNFKWSLHIGSQKRGTIGDAFLCTILASFGGWLVFFVLGKVLYVLFGG